eukprot:TRINITY_DN18306_c0_g1_i1.p1 TRINITY_DN18306_c0_g1~~TRINITY_DN18306_c0_g1_i1.p1  ORF type:complete len:192 (-),score=31.04 TRINITY_DN18306_c0_g1_i1:45-620(-)
MYHVLRVKWILHNSLSDSVPKSVRDILEILIPDLLQGVTAAQENGFVTVLCYELLCEVTIDVAERSEKEGLNDQKIHSLVNASLLRLRKVGDAVPVAKVSCLRMSGVVKADLNRLRKALAEAKRFKMDFEHGKCLYEIARFSPVNENELIPDGLCNVELACKLFRDLGADRELMRSTALAKDKYKSLVGIL